MDTKVQHWDKMYELPLEQIPWEIKEPPQELVELIESGQLKGGAALDVACGTGNYSFYLARNGFEVTGVDFSPQAIAIAKKNSESLGLPVKFLVADITEIDNVLNGQQFDFILDYSILHHLEHAVTESYARQCVNLLKPEGKLLLVCYSDKDEVAGGNPVVTGTYGNTMYYRTADEVRAAYRGFKELSYKETRLGKRQQHRAHCFLFEKS